MPCSPSLEVATCVSRRRPSCIWPIPDRGVEVLFTPGGSAPSIAQTVMMLLLALVRGLPELLDAGNAALGKWSTVDVGDFYVGIIGMGSIARRSPNWWRSPVLR